jgi:hypothetical protein
MLREYEGLIQTAGKIGSYSHLIWSTNTEDPALGKLLQEASEMGSELSQKLVFFDVEWLRVDDEKAQKLIQSKELAGWKHYLEVSRMYKDHTLSEDAEKVMSAKSVTGRAAWNRYFDETLGAARFELEGDELTEQEVLSKLHNPDRELRRLAEQRGWRIRDFRRPVRLRQRFADVPRPTPRAILVGAIALAMLIYERDHGTLPPAYSVDEAGRPLHSWRVLLLPYLGHQTLQDKIRLDEPWDSPNNLPLLAEMPDVYSSVGDAADSTTTRF